jgi:hypothetical protein
MGTFTDLVNGFVKNQRLVHKNITIDSESNIEEPHFINLKTLRVGQHHTVDPILRGILSY